MTDEDITIKLLNTIYNELGFDGVIEEIKHRLVYGKVVETDGLTRISTGGWSDDEFLLECLTHILCRFSRHYVGYIVGGAFFFDKDKSIESFNRIKLIKEEETI